MKLLVTATLLMALAGCGSPAAVHAASTHYTVTSSPTPRPTPATTECTYAEGNNYAANSGNDPNDIPALMVITITDSLGTTFQCTNTEAGFIPVADIANMGKEEFELSDGPSVNANVSDIVDTEMQTGNQVCGANAQQDYNADATVTVGIWDTGQSDDTSSLYAEAACKVGLGLPDPEITP